MNPTSSKTSSVSADNTEKTSLRLQISSVRDSNGSAISCRVDSAIFVSFLARLLMPRVQKIKIRYLTLNRLLIAESVKKMVHLGAHYSEHQGLTG